MILKNAKLYGQDGKWDIHIAERSIGTIKPAADAIESSNSNVIDLNGKIVLPPYVEPIFIWIMCLLRGLQDGANQDLYSRELKFGPKESR